MYCLIKKKKKVEKKRVEKKKRVSNEIVNICQIDVETDKKKTNHLIHKQKKKLTSLQAP